MSEPPAPVELVFLWHHHQPDYRVPGTGESLLPWVRLHATKDYLDMARRLERHPGIRAGFNFVPSLLDQLEAAETGASDALFGLLERPVDSLSPAERAELVSRCASAPRHALERWPRYAALARRAAHARRDGPPPGDDELRSLAGWFLLAWLDPTFHGEPEAARAIARAGDFTEEHLADLRTLHARLLREVVPAYRALADRGQIELSASAYYHPILPLLVGFEAARRARADLALPAERLDARADAARQIERALERHARAFGAPPRGMWPPEGSVSPETAELAARAGVRWLATDEGVLWRSMPPGQRRRDALYRPWKLETPAGEVAFLFRDHELSDRIGFVYHHWRAPEAVADFLRRVRRIGAEHGGARPPVVSVILDGENCWEGYADDGGPFLDQLYSALEAAPDIRTRTPWEAIEGAGPLPALPALHSGSWIDADFHIWIGHAEKNRAWDLVARTRRALVEAGSGHERDPGAWEALFAAEGSDWFWWYGDDHFTADRAIFDRLFREHLQAVYERMGWPVPAWLRVPIAPLDPRAGAERSPIGLVSPRIDGRRTHFYEWSVAGRFRLEAAGGAMHAAAGRVRELHFGFDLEHLYLRLDFAADRPPGAHVDLGIELVTPRPGHLIVRGLERGARPVTRVDGGDRGATVPGARCVIGDLLELALPFASLGLAAGEPVEMCALLSEGGEPLEALPGVDLIRFTVPDAGAVAAMWSA